MTELKSRKWITTCLMALFTFCLVLAGVFFISPIKVEAAVGDTFTLNNGMRYKILTEQEGDYTVEISKVNKDIWISSGYDEIPSIVEYNGKEYTVVGVGESAFMNVDLTGWRERTLPDSIKYIANKAFSGYKGKVIMQEGIKTIGDEAFLNSTALRDEIELPNSITYIGSRAFEGNSLKEITTSATYIGSNAFRSCDSLNTITLKDGVKTIGEYAFAQVNNNKLLELSFADTVEEIGDFAFYGNRIEEIVLPKNLKTIGASAFKGNDSPDIEVTFNEGLTKIGEQAFYGLQGLREAILPDSLITIEKEAFEYTGLTEITIPKNVKTIGDSAFEDCEEMSTLTVYSRNVTWGIDCLPIHSVNIGLKTVYIVKGSTTDIYILEDPKDITINYIAELTWDLGGGTASVELPSGYYAVGDTVTIRQVELLGLEKTGYELSSITINGTSHSGNGLALFLARGYSDEMPEGGLTIEIGWTGKEYTASFDQDGGTGGSPDTATFTYGEPYPLTNPVAPTRNGYRFEGYYADIQINTGFGRPQTMSIQLFDADMKPTQRVWNFDITRNITLTAKWTPVVTSITIPTGKQSQTYYLGAEFVPFTATATYGDNTTKDVEVTEAMLTNFSTDTMGTRTATITYEEKTATFEYTVSGYAYTVEHHQENLEDGNYTIVSDDTQMLYGVGTTAAEAKDYDGFTAQTFEQETIAEDGSTVIKIYYTRNVYDIIFDLDGGTIEGETNQSVKFKQDVTPNKNTPTKTGYTFVGYDMVVFLGDVELKMNTEPQPIEVMLQDGVYDLTFNVRFEAVWQLNKPTFGGTAGGALNYIYNGSAHNVTVNPSHELGNGVSYTFRWFRLNEGEANINSVDFSTDDLFVSRCELLNTSSGTYGSYRFTNVADSGVYYCVVIAKHGENTSQTAVEFTVNIEKAAQTITLSEDGFTYSEGKTIDFATLIGGIGDGILSFEVSKKNGVEFDFANGVVSNITKAGGTFTLTVNKAASDNYKEENETFTITLNKGEQSLSASGTPSAPSWKEGFTVSVSGNKGALSYAITSGNATVNNGVITATGAGQVTYSVTAAATDLYETATETFSVTFGKAAGNLAPDYELPTGLTICVERSTNDITLPSNWRFETETNFEQTGASSVDAIFTPEDQVNYEEYRTSVQITVLDHVGGTAASCTTAEICTECGEVLEEALGHTYTEQTDNEIRTTAQNCQECNTYWYDCSLCGESAKNDLNATDKWYTSTEAGSHNISADWTSENNQHFHKCTVAGCDYIEDNEDCDGGTATCQAKAICSTCGVAYGNLGDHNYNMDAWGYKGADGHAHNCVVNGCDEHDAVIPHTPNVDAATEDTAKYCTVCEFIIEQQLNHVHSEGTVWEHDSEYHWHDCVANDGQVYSKAAHTYDNACDTTCNGGCGYVRTITHDYSKLEKSDTQHWYVCSVCGEEKANSRVGHSGGTETCQTLANCSTCGQAYGSLGDHDYDTTKWVSVDERSHAHKCKHCDSYTEQTGHFSEDDATCTEDKICDACGYKMADRLGHTYTKQIETSLYLKAEGEDCQSHHTYYYACVNCDASSKDDTDTFFEGTAVGEHKMSTAWTTEYAQGINAGSHYHECTVDGCDYKADEGDCAGGERTCIALAVCNTCQKPYGTYAEHTYSTTWEYKEATGHAHVCTVTGCNAHDEIQAHTPNIPAATEDEAQVCTACEYQMAAALGHTHNPATVWTYNDTHHWKACSGCSAHLDEAPHSYEDDCDTDCECGYERSVMHDFTGEWQKDASGHWHVCENECGATDTKVTHVSAGAATETNPEVCSICGWEIAPALGHTTHTPETEWEKNDTHHWHECTGCDGQELDKAAHNDGNSDGSCDACGYTMTVTPPPHTHAHGSTWVTDEDEHWNECECGDKANKAVHVDSDNNGKCDTCDYTMSTGTVDPGNSDTQPPVDNPPTDDNDGLGAGAIVGIVLGSVAVVGGGGFALFWFVIRKKRR